MTSIESLASTASLFLNRYHDRFPAPRWRLIKGLSHPLQCRGNRICRVSISTSRQLSSSYKYSILFAPSPMALRSKYLGSPLMSASSGSHGGLHRLGRGCRFSRFSNRFLAPNIKAEQQRRFIFRGRQCNFMVSMSHHARSSSMEYSILSTSVLSALRSRNFLRWTVCHQMIRWRLVSPLPR